MKKFSCRKRSIFVCVIYFLLVMGSSLSIAGDLNSQNINQFDEKGWTPLMNEVMNFGRFPTKENLLKIKNMIELGADINVLSHNPYKKSAFHLSFIHGVGNVQMPLVKLLIHYGADIDSYDARGNGPLTSAISHKNRKLIQVFLKAGANPNQSYSNKDKATVLEFAITCSNVEAVKLLLEYGANPNLSFDRLSPLKYAIGKGEKSYEMVKSLIEAGANVNEQNYFGNSALHLARVYENKKIVELLLRHGALDNKSGRANDVFDKDGN